MNLSPQEVTQTFFSLPEQEQQAVFDFMEFLKNKSAKIQARRLLPTEEETQTEGERVLAILEAAELLGSMQDSDGKLSVNYKEHLWSNK
jgi:hypothetical protein